MGLKNGREEGMGVTKRIGKEGEFCVNELILHFILTQWRLHKSAHVVKWHRTIHRHIYTLLCENW